MRSVNFGFWRVLLLCFCFPSLVTPQKERSHVAVERFLDADGSAAGVQQQEKAFKFGMASGGSTFFDPIREGFLETCALLGVECEYFPENNTYFKLNYNVTEDLAPCVPQMRDMVARNFTGISLYCGVDHPILQEAQDRGIALAAFDIQPPERFQIPYVGTDNANVGESMARLLRLLKQIEPGETATYYSFSFRRIPGRYQGFIRELEKNNQRSDRGHWRMVTTNLTGNPEGDDLVLGETIDGDNQTDVLDRLAELNPDAIIFMHQSPMRRDGYSQWVEKNRWRNITIVGLQGNDEELQTLARRNVDGLIGQVAFDIGRLSAQTLYDVASGKTVPRERFTKLINYNLVPERLPDPIVDQNLLGNLTVFGYVAFAVVAATATACLVWTVVYRQGTVVRSSQPIFLAMTATGILVMASAILPLSMDTGDAEFADTWGRGVCMSPVWLVVLGFSVTFSALFAKTKRVNQFFNSPNRFERIQVKEKDVLVPFGVVVTLNVVILTIWTALDPLTYTREFEDGTDLYNREIASNGYCRSDHAIYFLLPLGIVNLALLVVACYQAYHARNIKSEFAEASYIALAVFSFMQAFITGIPVVAVVREEPQAFYLVLTSIIFVLSMVILLLIFLPKLLMERKYTSMTPRERRQSLAVSVRSSMMTPADIPRQPEPPVFSAPVPPSTSSGAKTAAPAPANMPSKVEEEEEEVLDPTDNTSNLYGSFVEKVDDEAYVMGDKKSTYASEELDAELKEAEEKEQHSTSMSGHGP